MESWKDTEVSFSTAAQAILKPHLKDVCPTRSWNSPLVNSGTSYFNILQIASYHAGHNQPPSTALLFLDAFSIPVIQNKWTLQAGTASFFQPGKQPACSGHHHELHSNNMNSVPGTKSRRSVVFDPPDLCSELQGKIKMQPISSARKFLPDPRLATKGTQDASQSCICFLHYSNLSNKNIFQIHNGQ